MNTQIHHDINDALSTNYLLVTCTLRQWYARAPDKQVARETAASHGASDDAVSVTKKLMVGASEEYDALVKTQNAIYTYVRTKTLPFAMNSDESSRKRGPRLLLSAALMEFVQGLKPLAAEFNTALGTFVSVYQQRVTQARGNLGTMDNADLYPDPAEIKSMFAVKVDYDPVPSQGDYSRMAIPAQLAEALGERLAGRHERALKASFGELRDRIAEELSRTIGQLSKVAAGEKTKLYKTMQTNVRTVVDLLKATLPLLGEDAQTVAMVRLTERLEALADTDVEVYKNSLTAARTNLNTAKDAMSALDEIEWF